MAQFREFHTSRKVRECTSGNGQSYCLHKIAKGDRYCRTALAPGGDMGNEQWWKATLCVPCAAGYGYTDPEATS